MIHKIHCHIPSHFPTDEAMHAARRPLNGKGNHIKKDDDNVGSKNNVLFKYGDQINTHSMYYMAFYGMEPLAWRRVAFQNTIKRE